MTEESARRYTVVVNHEEQYSIWPIEREIPAGWMSVGVDGTKDECLAHIGQVWTDMRPASVRHAPARHEHETEGEQRVSYSGTLSRSRSSACLAYRQGEVHPACDGRGTRLFVITLGTEKECFVTTNEVHVVRFCLDEPFPRALELLDSTERERAARFVYERDRRRYVTAHAWMRTALAKCLGHLPELLHFEADSGGKPRLVGIPIDLRFNLSHAGERGLLAIAIGQEVGVDIEFVRPVETLEVARRFFSQGEVSALCAMRPAQRVDAFFRCWTRKEAFIKALGAGLSFPLDGFEVSLGADD